MKKKACSKIRVKVPKVDYHSSTEEEEENAEKLFNQFTESTSLEFPLDEESEVESIILDEPEPEPSVDSMNILQDILKSDDNRQPILSHKKHIEFGLDDAKLEEKAKKIVSEKKKDLQSIGHTLPTVNDTEREYRKIATKGVVQLFNAIRAAQVTSQQEDVKKKEKPVVAKDSFLKVAVKDPFWIQPDFSLKRHWDQEEEDE